MNSKTAFLQIMFGTVIVVAQIYFPDDDGPYLPSKIENTVSSPMHTNREFEASKKQGTDSVIANSLAQLTLNINRILPTTSAQLAKADSIVYGPTTIMALLSLIQLASIGQTFNEVSYVMGINTNLYNDPLEPHTQFARLSKQLVGTSGLEVGHLINFATGIFVQQGFPLRLAYQQTSKAIYQSDITNLDFGGNPTQAQHVINSWVSTRTNGKIPALLGDAPPHNTIAIMVSVLYFKAAWEYPFYEGFTQPRPFYINGRKSLSDRKVLMMSNGGYFPYYKDRKLGLEIMGFPYKTKQATMYVILPTDSNLEKLKYIESILTPNDIERLVNSTKHTEAVILFPKMKLESSIDLKPALQKLGITTLFNPNQANLALLSPSFKRRFAASTTTTKPILTLEEGLIFPRFGAQDSCVPIYDPVLNVTHCRGSKNTGPLGALNEIRQQLNNDPNPPNPGIYVDQVIHKVFIDITESGTEAAAVSSGGINRSGGIVSFRCDIPFLFFIYHEETKIILFWGSVKSPPSISTTAT